MLAERKYYLKGLYVSLLLYAYIFVSLAYTLSKSDIFLERFTSKDNILDITIIEKPQEVTQPIQTTTTVQQKPANAPTSVKTQTMGVQDLFKNINATKLNNTGTKASTPSRLSGNSIPQTNASKILDNLNFKQQSTLVVTGASSGKYDPFIGKIQDILDEKWQSTAYTDSGAQAEVAVEINNNGNFSYYIVKLSYNNDFNSKLQNFLDEMKNEAFPPYEGVGKFTMKIIFKDLEE